jgi:hypothetical protein
LGGGETGTLEAEDGEGKVLHSLSQDGIRRQGPRVGHAHGVGDIHVLARRECGRPIQAYNFERVDDFVVRAVCAACRRDVVRIERVEN